MPELGALLFDLDGTLVDTAEANFSAYRAALGEVAVAIDRTTFDRVAAGRNWQQFLPGLLDGSGAADPADIARRKQALYPAMMDVMQVNQPLVDLARSVRPGLATGLVTSASRPSVSAVLGHHGLDDLFDAIVTGDDVVTHKPSPEPYLAMAALLGVAADRCLVFEDSDVGVASAHAAGMRVVRVRFP